MIIPLKKIIHDNYVTYEAFLSPAKQQVQPVDLDDILQGVVPVSETPPPDLSPKVFCCNDFAHHYSDLNNSDSFFHLSICGEENEPGMHLREMKMEYGEHSDQDYTIHFCPFCGEKFEFKIRKHYKRSRVDRKVINIVTDIKEEEIEG